jgi:hypothetical protein
VGHLRFWSLAGGRLAGADPVYGALGRAQTFLCAAFARAEYPLFGGERREEGGGEGGEAGGGCPGGVVTLTGTADGCVYLWEGRHLAKAVRRAHDGPVCALAAADPRAADPGALVLSAGRDGAVRAWRLADPRPAPRALRAGEQLAAEVDLRPHAAAAAAGACGAGAGAGAAAAAAAAAEVRSLCVGPGGAVYAGTAGNAVLRIDGLPLTDRDGGGGGGGGGGARVRVAVHGGAGRLVAAAGHPRRARVAAARDDGSLALWDLAARAPRAAARRRCGALGFDAAGRWLAAGGPAGAVAILAAADLAPRAAHADPRRRAAAVVAVRFAPPPGGGGGGDDDGGGDDGGGGGGGGWGDGDALLLAAAGEDGGVWVLRWDPAGGRLEPVGALRVGPAAAAAWGPSLDWARGGGALACGGAARPAALAPDGGGGGAAAGVRVVPPGECDPADFATWGRSPPPPPPTRSPARAGVNANA